MNGLHARPMLRERAIRYPTKLEVAAQPELLQRHMPPAWLSRAELATAAAAFLAVTVEGCSNTPEGVGGGRVDPGGPARVAPVCPPRNRTTTDFIRIVPPPENYVMAVQERDLGFLGCIAVAPPVFLSEDEALQVIRDEAAKYGLDLLEQEVSLDGVTMDWTTLGDRYDWITGRTESDYLKNSVPLELDLRDPGRNVGVVYVAECTVERILGEPGCMEGLSAASNVAQKVCEQVAANGPGVYFGAFYDPIEDLDEASMWATEGPAYARTKAECRRRLQEQVKSFVDWLKAQGVI